MLYPFAYKVTLSKFLLCRDITNGCLSHHIGEVGLVIDVGGSGYDVILLNFFRYSVDVFLRRITCYLCFLIQFEGFVEISGYAFPLFIQKS